MYSPDKEGEHAPEAAAPNGVLHFSVQGLMTEIPDVQLLPSLEFAVQLKVMMADYLGHPHPPVFLWNVAMVMHILNSDPMLRDLEHVQVGGPGMAYLFFFDKQGRHSLMHEAIWAMQAHVGEAFAEWISHSAQFAVNPLPLAEGLCCMVVASDRHRHQLWADCPGPVIPTLASTESNSALQLVGSAPPSTTRLGSTEDNGGNKSARSTTARLWGRPPKVPLMVRGGGNSPPYSSKLGEADSDGYSMVSEAPGG